jgi:hypothetical protein
VRPINAPEQKRIKGLKRRYQSVFNVLGFDILAPKVLSSRKNGDKSHNSDKKGPNVASKLLFGQLCCLTGLSFS